MIIYDQLINLLDLGIIKNKQECNNCNQDCEIEVQINVKIELKLNDIKWRCTKCRTKYSIFKNSIYYQNKIDLRKFHLICHFWTA